MSEHIRMISNNIITSLVQRSSTVYAIYRQSEHSGDWTAINFHHKRCFLLSPLPFSLDKKPVAASVAETETACAVRTGPQSPMMSSTTIACM